MSKRIQNGPGIMIVFRTVLIRKTVYSEISEMHDYLRLVFKKNPESSTI